MNKEQINNRLDDLSAVINYDFYKENRHFTAGEKICINQERGSLSDKLLVIDGLMSQEVARDYKVPPKLENKIDFVLTKIYNERQPN